MLHGRDIIFISSIEWGFNWQLHQEVASRLAKAGNRVLYIENTGIRAPALRDAKRVARRLQKYLGALRSQGLHEVAPDLYIYSPIVLPPFGAWWRKLNASLFLPMVGRAARRLKMRDAIVVTYLPTDTAIDLISLLRTPRSVVIYYRIDNLALLTPRSQELRQSEEKLMRSSDLVFTTSDELAKRPLEYNENVHVFPPSVNLKAFPLEEISAVSPSVPDRKQSFLQKAIKTLTRPVIGYIGAVTKHINFALVAAMAHARPEWSLVFVGPLWTDVGKLEKLSNVHFLGQRPHGDLVNYIRDFDVCIIPYNLNPYTDTVVPTKLNEYLAVGKPVVSTKLPAVCRFNEEHQILLTADEQPHSFLQAVEEALQLPKDAEIIKHRRRVAALGDWQTRIEAMSRLIEAELEIKNQ